MSWAVRIVSGVQSSGKLHVGNFYGAIRQFLRYQDEAESLYFIANLHSLTSVRQGELQRDLTREAAIAFLSLGLDPLKATLFRQSDVPEHTELYWLLGTVVPVSHLERAHSYKDKTSKGLTADFGLFSYPVLMASDILLYRADLVPVGKDQVQHVEFARDWATKFNVMYVPGYEPADPEGINGHTPGILKLPAAKILESTAVIPGVDGQKMSKSYGNTIDLFADEEEVKKRVMSIKTDSTSVSEPKPLDSPLYSLLKTLLSESQFAEMDSSWRAGGKGYGDYKKMLVEAFFSNFAPARSRRLELLKNLTYVDSVLKKGAEQAREMATPVITKVRHAMGL